jgi:hypothetical protein
MGQIAVLYKHYIDKINNKPRNMLAISHHHMHSVCALAAPAAAAAADVHATARLGDGSASHASSRQHCSHSWEGPSFPPTFVALMYTRKNENVSEKETKEKKNIQLCCAAGACHAMPAVHTAAGPCARTVCALASAARRACCCCAYRC